MARWCCTQLLLCVISTLSNYSTKSVFERMSIIKMMSIDNGFLRDKIDAAKISLKSDCLHNTT
jgi:hypothetical protein